jgi:hypothetical protein
MLHGFDQILKAALALPPGTRAMLADHLLASLDGPTKRKSTLPGQKKLRDEYVRSTKAKLS